MITHSASTDRLDGYDSWLVGLSFVAALKKPDVWHLTVFLLTTLRDKQYGLVII